VARRSEDTGAAAKTAGEQRGRPFKRGQSGNLHGRPVGSRHKTTLAVDALLDGEAETITRKAIELAKGGDTVALRLCMDRLAPVRKDRPVAFALPPITTMADVVKASTALLQAVASGELTPSEAAELGKLVEAHVKAIELTDIQSRLEALEQARTR
jgi:hypothetical protein